MRRTVRTTVLASTAAIAAAVGAVALAPIASAQDQEEPGPVPFGSSEMQSPDLAVSLGATCMPRAEDDEAEGELASLEITVTNVGDDAASLVNINYGVLPDVTGVLNEDVIDPDETLVYKVPTAMTGFANALAGAAVFSPQIDANYPNNFVVETLNIDCAEVPVDDAE